MLFRWPDKVAFFLGGVSCARRLDAHSGGLQLPDTLGCPEDDVLGTPSDPRRVRELQQVASA